MAWPWGPVRPGPRGQYKTPDMGLRGTAPYALYSSTLCSGFQPLWFISVFTLFLEAWCPALLLPAFHDGTSRSCECVARLSSVISDAILISSATWSLVTFRGTVVSQNPQLGATICYQFVFQVACGFFIATPTWERVWGIWNNEWMAIFLWSLSIRIFGLTITAIIIWIKSSIFWTIVVTTY